MSTDLESRVARFGEIQDNLDAWAKGSDTTAIDFGGGPVMSPQMLIKKKETEISVAADGLLQQSTHNVELAEEQATIAIVAAESASLTARVYATPAAGVDPAGTPPGVAFGQFFNVRSPSSDAYLDEYQNVGGVATPTGKSYPSADGLEQNFIDMTTSIALIATVVIENNAFA